MRSRMLAWIPFIRSAPAENVHKSADGFVPYKSADELLATPPVIERWDVLAVK